MAFSCEIVEFVRIRAAADPTDVFTAVHGAGLLGTVPGCHGCFITWALPASAQDRKALSAIRRSSLNIRCPKATGLDDLES